MPVKPFAEAKTRLGPWQDIPREALARGLYLDTLSVALAMGEVSRVLVVTADAEAQDMAVSMGALVVGDDPRQGINAAILRGAARACQIEPDAPVAAITADLPALRAVELSQVLAAARAYPRAFLADHTGCGTTLLAARYGHLLRPAFEGSSRRNHALSGAQEIAHPEVRTVRLDVDTQGDLQNAQELGLGIYTSRLLTR